MNISFEKLSDVSGVLTLDVVKADYEQEVNKALKEAGRSIQMPGFRPGHVPAGLVKKLHGTQVKLETINKMLGEKLFGYIREQQIDMLGEPLPHEGHEPQDIETSDDFTFKFDIAIAPQFDIQLTADDKIDYYDVTVDDEDIDKEVERLRNQHGHHDSVDSYEEGDILYGLLAELDAEGQPKEDGIRKERASLMPQYFKQKKQQKVFAKAKKNDVLVFNPSKAYDGSEIQLSTLFGVKKEEVAGHEGDFSFQVDEISRFTPAELNQDFFDTLFGKDAVKSEEELRQRLREQLQQSLVADSDYKFRLDTRAYAENKVGELQFPREELRRIMLQNNKDKDEKYVDDNFERSITELKWHLIREKLAKQHEVKVGDEDVRAAALDAARFQFAQYGIQNIPDEYLQNYAEEMLKNETQVQSLVERCIDQKLFAALKNVVTLEHKAISLKDFQKLFEA